MSGYNHHHGAYGQQPYGAYAQQYTAPGVYHAPGVSPPSDPHNYGYGQQGYTAAQLASYSQQQQHQHLQQGTYFVEQLQHQGYTASQIAAYQQSLQQSEVYSQAQVEAFKQQGYTDEQIAAWQQQQQHQQKQQQHPQQQHGGPVGASGYSAAQLCQFLQQGYTSQHLEGMQCTAEEIREAQRLQQIATLQQQGYSMDQITALLSPAGVTVESEHQEQVEDAPEEAAVADKNKDPNYLPQECDGMYNMNAALVSNIQASSYFQQLPTDFMSLVDEIYERVDHVEAKTLGTELPSTAFCILYRLLQLHLTYKEIDHMLRHRDSPFIRAIGCLYLRYVCPSSRLWSLLHPFVNDPEMFAPSGKKMNSKREAFGDFVRRILASHQYPGTLLKRIPVPVARDIKGKLAVVDLITERTIANAADAEFIDPGLECQCIYMEDGKRYDVVIEKILNNGEQYRVRYTAYKSCENVPLGALYLPDSITNRRKRSNESGSRSRSRSRSPSPASIQARILKEERASATVGRNGKTYRRVGHANEQFAMKHRAATTRDRSRSPIRRVEHVVVGKDGPAHSDQPKESKKRKAAPLSAEARKRMADLKAKYGDASAEKGSHKSAPQLQNHNRLTGIVEGTEDVLRLGSGNHHHHN